MCVAKKEPSPDQKAAMDQQMKNLQEFLQKAESEGKADRPMMIKEVDGKMVMEPIPEEMMGNFVFPDQIKEDI